jgi:hypothetical protein
MDVESNANLCRKRTELPFQQAEVRLMHCHYDMYCRQIVFLNKIRTTYRLWTRGASLSCVQIPLYEIGAYVLE